MIIYTPADASSLLALLNQVDRPDQRRKLPCKIKIDSNTYYLTEANFNAFKLGVMAAADWKAYLDGTL